MKTQDLEKLFSEVSEAERRSDDAETHYNDVVSQLEALNDRRGEEGTDQRTLEEDIKDTKARIRKAQRDARLAMSTYSEAQKKYIQALRKMGEPKEGDEPPKRKTYKTEGSVRGSSTSGSVQEDDMEAKMKKIALETYVSPSERKFTSVKLTDDYGFEDDPPKECLERLSQLTKRRLLGDEVDKKNSLSLDLVVILLNDQIVLHDLSSVGALKALRSISIGFAFSTVNQALERLTPISEVIRTLRQYYDRNGLTKSQAKDDLSSMRHALPHRKLEDLVKYIHKRCEVLFDDPGEAVVETARECRALFKNFFENSEGALTNTITFLELSSDTKIPAQLLVDLLEAVDKHLPTEVPRDWPTKEDIGVSSTVDTFGVYGGSRNTHGRNQGNSGWTSDRPRDQGPQQKYENQSIRGKQPQDGRRLNGHNAEGQTGNWNDNGFVRRCFKCGSQYHLLGNCDVYPGYATMSGVEAKPCCGFYHSDNYKGPCISEFVKPGYGNRKPNQVSAIQRISTSIKDRHPRSEMENVDEDFH